MSTATLITAEQLLEMPVTVYRSATDIETLSASAELDGGSLLPGFRGPISDLFADPWGPG